MGKEGDLWDDSALINAFDDAISKYKVMHGRGQQQNPKTGEGVNNGTEELTYVDENYDAKRQAQVDGNSNVAPCATTELRETNNVLPDEQNQAANSFSQQQNVDSLCEQNAQDALQSYSNAQGPEGYTQLLNQYYEIEEQRQKILQQLQAFGYWNFQDSGPSVQWGTCSASQEYPVTTNQASYPAVVSSCCPYVGHCLVAPCSLGGTCDSRTCDGTSGITHNGKSTSLEDSNVIKTAMEAAEKALSSLKMDASENAKERHEGKLEATCGETDLNVVFNAWYSAGFHTGKYLAEHSIAKKRRG